MNADAHQQLGGRYGVKGFPSIKIFGANKNKPTDYQGVYIIRTSLFVSSPKHFSQNQSHFVKTHGYLLKEAEIDEPSIITPYTFLWTYGGGSGHIYVSVAG